MSSVIPASELLAVKSAATVQQVPKKAPNLAIASQAVQSAAQHLLLFHRTIRPLPRKSAASLASGSNSLSECLASRNQSPKTLSSSISGSLEAHPSYRMSRDHLLRFTLHIPTVLLRHTLHLRDIVLLATSQDSSCVCRLEANLERV